MASVISLLNSSTAVIAQNASWSGSIESVKNFNAISYMILTDVATSVTVHHMDKLGNSLTTETFTCVANTALFKQFYAKTSHFKIVMTTSVADMSAMKLITKLTNSMPDDEHITAKLTTTQGDLSSSSGKLLVSQNVLAPATDGVLSYGLQDGTSTKVALKVDAGGVLSVAASLAQLPGNNFCTTSLTHAPQQVVGSAKRVIRMNCFNDGAQVVYVRLHDIVSAPPINTDVPVCVFALQPMNNINVEIGVNFALGVYATASSNVGKTSAFGTVGAEEVGVNVVFE